MGVLIGMLVHLAPVDIKTQELLEQLVLQFFMSVPGFYPTKPRRERICKQKPAYIIKPTCFS